MPLCVLCWVLCQSGLRVFHTDQKTYKQKEKTPAHGFQILKGRHSFWKFLARLDSLFLSLLKTGSCIRKQQDLLLIFFSPHFKSQCSSPWIYSRCFHPYISPRHSVFRLNACWILIFLFCLSRYLITWLMHVELQHATAHQSGKSSEAAPVSDPEPEHPTYELDSHISPAL